MSRKAFAFACTMFLVVCLLLGLLLKLTQRDDARPEGVAERWLAAVSDLTRKGVGEDAAERTGELAVPGPFADDGALAGSFVSAGERADLVDLGKTVFTAIEVGKFSDDRVPFRVQIREGDVKRGTVDLVRTPEGWRVAGVAGADPALKVPSDGGAPPSRAAAPLWFGAIALAGLLTLIATGLVKLAERPQVA